MPIAALHPGNEFSGLIIQCDEYFLVFDGNSVPVHVSCKFYYFERQPKELLVQYSFHYRT